jgi:hypothetical protein
MPDAAAQVDKVLLACFCLGLSTRKAASVLVPVLGEKSRPQRFYASRGIWIGRSVAITTGQLRITTAISSFALAIRQVAIGLASMVSLLFGLTVNVYGVALPVDSTYPKWLGGLASVGGVPTMIAGVLVAYTGFSCCWLGCSRWESSCGGAAEFGWMKRRSNNSLKTTLVALAARTER